jgi:hypothetical protein
MNCHITSPREKISEEGVVFSPVVSSGDAHLLIVFQKCLYIINYKIHTYYQKNLFLSKLQSSSFSLSIPFTVQEGNANASTLSLSRKIWCGLMFPRACEFPTRFIIARIPREREREQQAGLSKTYILKNKINL